MPCCRIDCRAIIDERLSLSPSLVWPLVRHRRVRVRLKRDFGEMSLRCGSYGRPNFHRHSLKLVFLVATGIFVSATRTDDYRFTASCQMSQPSKRILPTLGRSDIRTMDGFDCNTSDCSINHAKSPCLIDWVAGSSVLTVETRGDN